VSNPAQSPPDVPEELAIDLDEEEEIAEPFATSAPISYFGTDFDVLGLVRRLEDGDIVVPNFYPADASVIDLAGFQRGFVWRKYQMDRFVESMLLGYPVPGIFLVQQGDRKLLVLDGQQRLRTLQRYYSGTLEDGSAFRLENVGDAFKNLTYDELQDEDRRALNNNSLHATVIRYDADPGGHGDEAIYQLFERLNTGGTNLYPQEIRVALYPGVLVDFIRRLNDEPNWRYLYGKTSDRLKDQELILRFLALYTSANLYKRPLKGFLNDFLKLHRNLEGLNEQALEKSFAETCAALARGPGQRAFRSRRQVNAALVDSVLVGVAKRLEQGPIEHLDQIEARLDELLANDDFQSSIARATADEDRVARRLGLATEAFSTL
jgi:hypothetical protein